MIALTSVPQELYTECFFTIDLITPKFISYSKRISDYGGGAHAYGTDHVQTVDLRDFLNYGTDSLHKGSPSKTANLFEPHVWANRNHINEILSQYWEDHWNRDKDSLIFDSVFNGRRSAHVIHNNGCYQLGVTDYLFIGYANALDGDISNMELVGAFECDSTKELSEMAYDYYISPRKTLVVLCNLNSIQVVNTRLDEVVFETSDVQPNYNESFSSAFEHSHYSATMTEWCSSKHLHYWKQAMQAAKTDETE